MSSIYYLENNDLAWFGFFNEYMENLFKTGHSIDYMLLSLYYGKTILSDDDSVTDVGSPHFKIVGVEFETEEDKTHFLLKFKGKICKAH